MIKDPKVTQTTCKTSPTFRKVVWIFFVPFESTTRNKRRTGTRPKVKHHRIIIITKNLTDTKQLLDEVEHDIMNYQNRGLCYLPKPKAEADNTDTRF